MRRIFTTSAVVLGTLALATVAWAEEKPLTGADITAALSGNTAVGGSGDEAWRQYFDPSGETTYVVKGKEPDAGKWRVTDDDKYCSWWEATGWDCYTMTGDADRVTWIYEKDGSTFPAKMVQGKALQF